MEGKVENNPVGSDYEEPELCLIAMNKQIH